MREVEYRYFADSPGCRRGFSHRLSEAPFSYEATRGLFQRLADFGASAVRTTIKALEDEDLSFVNQGAAGQTTTRKPTAFMRYSGQGWEIPVSLGQGGEASLGVQNIEQAFEQGYRTLFGRTIDGLCIEITNWSLTIMETSTIVTSDYKAIEQADGSLLIQRKELSA